MPSWPVRVGKNGYTHGNLNRISRTRITIRHVGTAALPEGRPKIGPFLPIRIKAYQYLSQMALDGKECFAVISTAMSADKRIIRRSIAVFLILSGAIILVGGIIIGFLNQPNANSEGTKLPNSIAGLGLNSATYGPEAVAEISRMHGKEFPIDYGALGIYGDANQISLWVASFSNRSTATQIIKAMEEKIALGSSPFKPTGQQQVGGRAIYRVEGTGQNHIYFQSGNLIIWLAADPSFSDQAFRQIEEVYP